MAILKQAEQWPFRCAAEVAPPPPPPEPTRLYGGAHVANELGVAKNALQNWRVRYHGTPRQTPVPTHLVADGMPLWDDSGLQQWRDWHATHKKSGGG